VNDADGLDAEVRRLDLQQKRLLALISRFRRMTTDSIPVDEIIAALGQYTEAHFSLEERIMSVSGYPGFDEHKIEHDLMADKVRRLQSEIIDGNHSLAEELVEYLSAWWEHHSHDADMKYRRHVFAPRFIPSIP